MNKHIRNHVASLFLLAPFAAVTLIAVPTAALAQSASPEIRSVEVRSDAGLQPGARLAFRLVGTPGARAALRIHGLRERIELREVSRGLYVGRYVIKRGDRLQDDAEVRATLRAGNRSEGATYTLAEAMSGPPPVAVVPPPPPPPAPPPLRIERFALAPIDRIEPGAELRFVLEGFPGATAVVDLPGVSNDLALREIRPGHYEGAYTIRRADNLNLSRPIVATLRAGERTVTASIALPQQPPPVVVPVALPLQVLSHPNNGQAVGGSTQVQGRTAPFASVAVTVDASAPVPGGLSVAQHISSQTVQADGNGNFGFSFSPRFVIPGARYDILMVASKANVNTEARLVLFQR